MSQQFPFRNGIEILIPGFHLKLIALLDFMRVNKSGMNRMTSRMVMKNLMVTWLHVHFIHRSHRTEKIYRRCNAPIDRKRIVVLPRLKTQSRAILMDIICIEIMENSPFDSIQKSFENGRLHVPPNLYRLRRIVYDREYSTRCRRRM